MSNEKLSVWISSVYRKYRSGNIAGMTLNTVAMMDIQRLTLNRLGFLQIGMAGGGQILPPPPSLSVISVRMDQLI